MKLCPFEKTKKWKTGISVKCPKSTGVMWTQDEEEKAIHLLLSSKRRTTCINCKQKMIPFLESEVD